MHTLPDRRTNVEARSSRPSTAPTPAGAPLDGIINFDKPSGITSAKALYRVRAITGQKKSGHAGTLDPAATGVLVLCLGRATKLVESIMDQPKVYRATARLDVTSESFDSDRPLIPVEVKVAPTEAVLREALASFEGDIEQVPPRISAIKIGGVPAYKRSADDPALVLRPRIATIYWLHVHRYDWPELDFEMCCGRGTYVRSIIRDLGKKLGTGGCLTSLVRKRVGPFDVEQAWTIPRLETAAGAGHDSAGYAGAEPSGPTRPYLIDLERARELLAPKALTVPPRPK